MHKKIFLFFVLIIVLLSIILGFFSVNISKYYYMNEYEEHLLKETKMLADLFTNGYDNQDRKADYLNDFSSKYSKELEYRITFIAKDGLVLADSGIMPQGLENHSNREEFKQALSGKKGITKRYSQSMKVQFLYCAVPASLDGELVIIRTAVPLMELDLIKNQILITILGGIIFAACIAFFIAYYIAGKMAKPLDELTKTADEISKGKFGKTIPIQSEDQLGILTRAFNHMSEELSITIDQLEEENSKLESIVNSMADGLIAINTDYKIMMINDECFRLFRIKLSNIIGYNFYDIVRNEDVNKALDASRRTQNHCVDEFELKHPLEGNKIIRIQVNPIFRNNMEKKEIGSLILFQDVTQIRKLEKLRNDFVSNVTHELKTPLTSIMGFTDTLKSGAVTDTNTALHFIDIIEIEAQRLFRLIQDILSLSELETRREDVNMVKTCLSGTFYRIQDMLMPSAIEKKIELKFEIDENLAPFLCNRDRISQMCLNLIDNAMKYTEEGRVLVSCKKVNNDLVFMVEDTGIGIPKENQARIFERFYRVDKGRSRKAGGTGLGLSIVKHIVLLYGGSIFLESDEGKGSIFTIRLPYIR